jgi:hypothetical protein
MRRALPFLREGLQTGQRGERRLGGGAGNTRGGTGRGRGQHEGSVGRGQCGSDSSKGEARRGGGMAAPGANTVFLISSIMWGDRYPPGPLEG